MSRAIVRSIVFEEIKSKDLKYSNEELEEVAKKMEANLEIM